METQGSGLTHSDSSATLVRGEGVLRAATLSLEADEEYKQLIAEKERILVPCLISQIISCACQTHARLCYKALMERRRASAESSSHTAKPPAPRPVASPQVQARQATEVPEAETVQSSPGDDTALTFPLTLSDSLVPGTLLSQAQRKEDPSSSLRDAVKPVRLPCTRCCAPPLVRTPPRLLNLFLRRLTTTQTLCRVMLLLPNPKRTVFSFRDVVFAEI